MKLRGAYIAAWVWVDATDLGEETDIPVSDDLFRQWAKRQWAKDGEVEFDDEPKVSRSYEGG